MTTPKVSVCMITYNHEPFIERALDGVLMQETTFEFEVIIGDDCSTDGTRRILERYAEGFKDKIRLVGRAQNVGPKQNFVETFSLCRAEYVALLDGDDYWTSAKKLQKQVEFLDSNSDCAICYHAVSMVDRAGREQLLLPVAKFREKRIATLEDLVISESFMATCSVMFRNRLFSQFPSWFFSFRNIVDLPLNILNAQHGDIGYIDEVMAVYRSNSSEGAFSAKPQSEINREAIVMFKGINEQLNYAYDSVIKNKISRNYVQIADEMACLGRTKEARQAFRAAAVGGKIGGGYIGYRQLIKTAARVYLPIVFWLLAVARKLRVV
jgi:glycosyltransferase involved in cell wall biosynthesis